MLKLVTISRISKEKGFERMLQLETMLAASGIAFTWDCYGDLSTNYAKQIVPRFKHVKFKGVTNKAKEVIKGYDYLVQLSDTEGFPYSIYEAMQQRIPVIATDFPSIHEMIIDGDNGHILKMDLSNFNDAAIERVPVIKSFTEKSTEQDWIKLLTMATKPDRRRKTEVKVILRYHDTQFDKKMKVGDTFKVTTERLKQLTDARVVDVINK